MAHFIFTKVKEWEQGGGMKVLLAAVGYYLLFLLFCNVAVAALPFALLPFPLAGWCIFLCNCGFVMCDN